MTDALPLLRGDRSVRSFLSSLGRVKETRLTATVGFLAARLPKHFLPLFGIGEAASVTVEETSDDERFDVILRGTGAPIVVEGKVGHFQDESQLARYAARAKERFGRKPQLALIDRGSHAAMSRAPTGFRGRPIHVTWTQVASACRKAADSARNQKADPVAVAIARDLADHLEENAMVEDARKDIYSRDVSARETIELIFRHNVYTCQPEYLKSASGGRYFAPYFTAAAAKTFEGLTVVPVPQGISFVSAVKGVQIVARNEVGDLFRATRGAAAKEIQALVRSHHPASAKEILVMELGQPYQLFHPAVTKRQLGIIGAMGSQSFSLERLLQAANSGST